MRKRFEQAPELDFHSISEVQINTKTRHQLAPILVALQYIFTTPELNEQVFMILEEDITKKKKRTGRMGMSLWEILVLGVVRLNLDIDYDFLIDQANNHDELRGILGVRSSKVFNEKKLYKLQTIVDNVHLLEEETIVKINEVLVKAGHQIIKKKENEDVLALNIKSDSYAVESNIHFPTDINLSWDSVRKCLDTIEHIQTIDENILSGWRKIRSTRKTIKSRYRKVANIHSKKGKHYQQRLEGALIPLLDWYARIASKVELSIEQTKKSTSLIVGFLGESLKDYMEYLKKFTDQLRRRILQGETIAHEEKVFSIFEPHVEWLQKGKQGNKVELGHNVLVTTDQYHLIIDYKVMVGQKDSTQVHPLTERLIKRFREGYAMKSISFDRGFYSALSKEHLEKIFEEVVLPRKGRPTKRTIEEEEKEEYQKLKNAHSAVESNINELEQSGVNKVPDKGIKGFHKYVGVGVLAYNLKRLGKLILAEAKSTKKKQSRRLRKAA